MKLLRRIVAIPANDDCMLGSCVHYSSPNKFYENDEKISSNDSDNTDSSGRENDGDQVTYSKVKCRKCRRSQ